MTRSGIPRRLPGIAHDRLLSGDVKPPPLMRSRPTPGRPGCSRTNTSRWIGTAVGSIASPEKLSVRGRSGERPARSVTRAIPRSTSTGSGLAMTALSRRPIPGVDLCSRRTVTARCQAGIAATCLLDNDGLYVASRPGAHAGSADRRYRDVRLRAFRDAGRPFDVPRGARSGRTPYVWDPGPLTPTAGAAEASRRCS